MKSQQLNINGIDFDAAAVVNEMLGSTPKWKSAGWEFLIQLLDPSDFSVKFQTSGTTGVPKQISFSKNQIWKSAENSCRFFDIKMDDELFLCLPSEFVAGRMMMARALFAKAKLNWVEPTLNPDLGSGRIDFAAFTPAQVSTLLKKSAEKLKAISKVIIGGGEISYSLEQELINFPNEIFATYGMTETLTHVAVRKIGESVYRSVYPDSHFTVNAANCLEIYVPFISPEKLVTHDIVELIDNRSFIWKGRLDNIINTGGIKIYAEEIERLIVESKVLHETDFYITSQKDPIFGEVPVIVMLKNRVAMDVAELLVAINGLLNKYQQVKHIYFFDKFEFTVTGKIKRQKY